jgi:carboxyl-terminal processing protease
MPSMNALDAIHPTRPLGAIGAVLFCSALLSACGSGGSDTPPGSPVGSVSNQYAQQCSPNNPYRQDSDAGTNPAPGTLTLEKQWAREYINEAYYWYAQVPSVDANASTYSRDTTAGLYPSLSAYFLALTTTPNDRFSLTYPTRAWKQLSQAGVSVSYGAEFAQVATTGGGAAYRIAFVEPGSPAATAGLRRGDTVAAIDGQPVASLGADAIDAALLPSSAATHDFDFTRVGAGTISVRLTAAAIAMSPVPSTVILNTAGGRIGYLLFNDHTLTAEDALFGAVQGLAAQGIDDLVIDLRYNRGGYVFISSQLAYMVAGASRTASRVFERQQYSDKRVAESNSTASIMPFFNVKCEPDPAQGFGCTSSDILPTLTLSRVWVLAGPDTCSASEAFVNGLRGIDINVTLVGGTTCGKPYAFTAKDNCGISYFPIESKGVNAKGFGDYAAGFAATCAAADDFDHALGDPAEGMLAAALAHRAGGACPVPSSAVSATSRLAPRPERSLKIDLPLRGMPGISR